MHKLKFTFLLFLTVSINNIFAQPTGNFCLLNGTDNYIEIPDNKSLDFTHELSLDVWVNLCNIDGNYIIISKNYCLNHNLSYYFSIHNGKLLFRWSSNGICEEGNSFKSKDIVVKKNEWTNIAISFSSTGIKLYVNGKQVAGSLTGSFSSIYKSDQPIKIGSYRFLNGSIGNFFPGKIDNLRIWKKYFTASQMKEIYQNKITDKKNDLVVYFDMDSIKEGYIINHSVLGNTNNGKLCGSNGPYIISSFKLNLGSDMILCNDEPLNLKVEPLPGANIKWNNGEKSNEIMIRDAGIYWVEYTIGKCILTDTIEVGKKDMRTGFLQDTTICNKHILVGKNLSSGYYFYKIADQCREDNIKGWLNILK
ncbi:MAG: LamG domain-containing protein [Candidatus Cyclobacteriaceae bacterium M3_2C_046]